jgi:hypothetical protein
VGSNPTEPAIRSSVKREKTFFIEVLKIDRFYSFSKSARFFVIRVLVVAVPLQSHILKYSRTEQHC